MIRFLHRLLMLAAALAVVVGTASAQTRKAYDLRTDYGLTEMQSKLQLSNLGTIDAAKAKYPRAYARLSGLGWTDAKFLTLSAFDAAWMDAVYQGQGGGQPITGVLNSQNHVNVPPGRYWQTVTAEFSGGEYTGAGTGYVGDGSVSINTELVVWHELWNGPAGERHCLQSGTWGGAGNFSYVEATRIEGFALNGRSREFATVQFNSSGIRMWKPGEVTFTTDVYARNFRSYGIEMYAPTPHHMGTISVFDNVKAGIGCVGCWGGTVNIDEVSGDDNGAMIESIAGNGSEGGGTWNIGVVKHETCVATSDRAHRGQAVAVMGGQYAMHIGAVSAASGSCDIDALFVLDTRLTNGTPQNSYVRVGAMKGFNYATIVHDLVNRKRWASPGDYVALGFEWTYRGGGTLTTVPGIASAAACSTRVDFLRTSGTPSHTTCTPYRYIIDGPPRSTTTVYLDAAAPPPPPPPPTCTWVLGTPGSWGACVNGQETRTTPYVSSVAGCTPTTAKPADVVETRACTVTPPPPPPPTGSGIDMNDVLVVTNSADSRTAAWGAAYAAAWGIPASNVIAVNAGGTKDVPVITDASLSALKSAVDAKGKQFTVLAWEYPSRLSNGQCITSAVTFGKRDPNLLTVSPLYNYTGFKPRTDKGVAETFLLVSDKYIRRDAHGTNPTGQAILMLAKDQTGTPRGSARAGQTASGVTVWDNRTYSGIGNGANACNCISNDCWRADRKPGTTPVIAGYQSNYQLLADGGTVWAKGFFGDHVTSYGGFLPAGSNGLNGQNQTPLTYHLDRGASFSVGPVSEPYQGANGSLPPQFVNVNLFHPRFVGGLPVGVAAWSSVQCPDRALMAGDGLCSPFWK